MKYTEEQKRIIFTKEPVVEVMAYAGSGKTYTLRRRVKYCLAELAKTDEILILSFTNKAVKNARIGMKSAVEISTFHAFCLSLIRKYYAELGFEKRPKKLLEGAGKIKLLRDSLKQRKGIVKKIRDVCDVDLTADDELKRLLGFFDFIQGSRKLAKELIDDADGEFYCYRHVEKKIGKIYKSFKERKIREGKIDYADMLSHGRKLSEIVGKGWKYKYLFIDESQDMTLSQSRLLKALAECIPNIMVFGDPRQSIYGFAGGAYRNLEDLLGRKSAEYSLTKSFRLTQPSADLVNALFKQMDRNAPMIMGEDSDLKPELIVTDDQESQVSTRIKKIMKKEPLASVAVLARTKAQLRRLETALVCEQIDVASLAEPLLRGRFEAVLNLIQLLEKYERVSKAKKIDSAVVETGLLGIVGIVNTGLKSNTLSKCRRLFTQAVKSPSLTGRYEQMAKLYLKICRSYGELSKDELTEIRNSLGKMGPYLYNESSVDDVRRNLAVLSESSKVATATIHAAKGLEFDYVFVLNVVQGCMPFYKQIEKGEVDEELRLFYVACSRAKKRTYLLQTPYFTANDKAYKKKSQFLTKSVMKTLTS